MGGLKVGIVSPEISCSNVVHGCWYIKCSSGRCQACYSNILFLNKSCFINAKFNFLLNYAEIRAHNHKGNNLKTGNWKSCSLFCRGTYGPAQVVMDDQLFEDVSKYISHYRPATQSPFVFLNWSGSQMVAGGIGGALTEELRRLGSTKRFIHCHHCNSLSHFYISAFKLNANCLYSNLFGLNQSFKLAECQWQRCATWRLP